MTKVDVDLDRGASVGADMASQQRAVTGLLSGGLNPPFVSPPRSGVASAWYEHVPFAYWIIQALRPRRFVELGTHNGVSYTAFCDAVARARLDTQCFAVDTWRGDEHSGFYGEQVFEELRLFHDPRFSAFSELVRSSFDNALEYFEDCSVDLLHIDGCHTYDDVLHDFERWAPKLSASSVVLLHDTNVRERDFGVWRLWSELRQRHPGFEFLHGHGLGVLATGSNVPDSVLAFCTLSSPGDIALVRDRFAAAGRFCGIEAEIARLRAETASLQVKARQDTVVSGERDAARKAHVRLAAVARAQELAAADVRAKLEQSEQIAGALAAELAETRASRDALYARLAETAAAEVLARAEIGRLHQSLAAYEQSTTWRIMHPVRATSARVPAPVRRAGRRALKLAWWSLRPLRVPARLRARRALLDSASVMQFGAPEHVPVRDADTEITAAAAPAIPDSPFSPGNVPRVSGHFLSAQDWYDPETPEVSIVVLNWNRSAMTIRCLEHLWQRTDGYRYEIIVIDNGSSDDELTRLQSGVTLGRVIPLGTNRYFGEANNIGVEAARGQYVCLLNNDAFVHEDWLPPLVRPLEADPRAGAAGPRLVNLDGRLQEAGALVNPDGSVLRLGNGSTADDPVAMTPRRVDYISAACLLMRRSDYLQVLGFDLAWDPAYYEDVDLCLKLRLLGQHTIYCPTSIVTHIENATSVGLNHGLLLDNIVAINRVKFVARWGAWLRTGGATEPELIPARRCAAGAAPSAPRVAIYTPYNLIPGGGERYLLTLAEALRDHAELTLVTPFPFSGLRLLTLGREFGLQTDHVQRMTLEQLGDSVPFDLAFILGNEIYPPIGRIAAHNVYICQFPFPCRYEEYLRRTRPFWNDYDVVITYSDFVHRHVVKAVEALGLPMRAIEVLEPPVSLLPVGLNKRAQILHVGRFFTGGHCKRQDILIEAFRKLIAEGASAELHLAGSIHPEAEHRAYYAELVERARGLPVFFHANCSPEELGQLYVDSLIYWHATGFGHDIAEEPHAAEHFGISVIEAMSAGCIPIVYAAGGPAEIVAEGATGFHFSTLEELCAKTGMLLQDTPAERLRALSGAAADAARPYDKTAFQARVVSLAGRFVACADGAAAA